jgi:DNA-binding HxlR family transcriptional regulator
MDAGAPVAQRDAEPVLDQGSSVMPACRAREVLDLIADKWSLHVIATLGDGPQRFTELRHLIVGISPRMLTVTLRGLERDGILTRTVYEVMPPNVTYELTNLGRSLLEIITPLIAWSEHNLPQVDAAREAFDRRQSESRARQQTPGQPLPEVAMFDGFAHGLFSVGDRRGTQSADQSPAADACSCCSICVRCWARRDGAVP